MLSKASSDLLQMAEVPTRGQVDLRLPSREAYEKEKAELIETLTAGKKSSASAVAEARAQTYAAERLLELEVGGYEAYELKALERFVGHEGSSASEARVAALEILMQGSTPGHIALYDKVLGEELAAGNISVDLLKIAINANVIEHLEKQLWTIDSVDRFKFVENVIEAAGPEPRYVLQRLYSSERQSDEFRKVFAEALIPLMDFPGPLRSSVTSHVTSLGELKLLTAAYLVREGRRACKEIKSIIEDKALAEERRLAVLESLTSFELPEPGLSKLPASMRSSLRAIAKGKRNHEFEKAKDFRAAAVLALGKSADRPFIAAVLGRQVLRTSLGFNPKRPWGIIDPSVKVRAALVQVLSQKYSYFREAAMESVANTIPEKIGVDNCGEFEEAPGEVLHYAAKIQATCEAYSEKLGRMSYK